MDQMNELLCTIHNLQDENRNLKEQCNRLTFYFDAVFKRLNLLEQQNIWSFIEIIGVPMYSNENCVNIVEKIASVLGIELFVANAFRYRLESQNHLNLIVADVVSVEQKRRLMKLAKRKKLVAKQLNNRWGYTGIYVNNLFTDYNRCLFHKCRMFAKENGFRFVWFHDCNIYIKKDDNSEVFVIQDELDLLKL